MISRSGLVKQCGVSKRTLEHYASKAGYYILVPVRTDTVGCWYQDDAVDILENIKKLKNVGFSLKEISKYENSSEDVRHQMLLKQIPVLDARISRVVKQKQNLEQMLEEAK